MTININKNVGINDTLYHLGDFAFRSVKDITEYRERINCKNVHLLLGNHDKLKLHEKRLFMTVSGYKELRYAKQTIVMCHYAMRVWNKSHHGSIMLYGHSHGSLPSQGKSFDVGVDCWDFAPISLDFVLEHTKNL